MLSSPGDPWEDEGFGGEDDWEEKESVETDLESQEDVDPDELGDDDFDDVTA
ncbi:MAG: hypothetical protein ACRDNY_09555 [Gaiellaceae bacterium]